MENDGTCRISITPIWYSLLRKHPKTHQTSSVNLQKVTKLRMNWMDIILMAPVGFDSQVSPDVSPTAGWVISPGWFTWKYHDGDTGTEILRYMICGNTKPRQLVSPLKKMNNFLIPKFEKSPDMAASENKGAVQEWSKRNERMLFLRINQY